MAASVQFRPQNRDLGMVMREVDEDLAIFLGIQNGGRAKNDHVLVEESDGSKSAEKEPDSLNNASHGESSVNAADDNLLNLETQNSDNNWLLTQVDSSLLGIDMQDSAASPNKTSNDEANSLKSEMENTSEFSASRSDTSTSANRRRPLSSDERKPARRAATPTGRPSLPAKPKPSRASTPTSRSTFPSSKPVVSQARSPASVRPTPRSSTPSSRPFIPVVSKSAPRSTTPTRKPATPSTSGRKTGSTSSRSSKPSDVLSVSQNAPQNPKVSMPKRPASASRERMRAPSAATHLSSSNEKTRRRSCSPPKIRAPITTAYKTGSKMLSRSRGYEGDDVNPVIIGTKMVDRVVNMRKLAPPKQDEYVSNNNSRKSSQENSGFGRSLSKKSLDMAIRHMDIRRSIGEKLRTPGAQSDCAK